MFHKILTIGAFFLGLAFICRAQPVISVKTEKENINIIQYVAIFKDSSGKLSLKEVSSPQFENKFILNSGKISNFGSTFLPIWCRFTVKNYTDQKLVLAVDNSQMESLDLFILNATNYTHKSISVYKPFNQREIFLNKCFFLIDIPRDSTRALYLRLQTQNGLQFPLQLSTTESLAESEQTKNILYGIYIGIMLIMILYNLFIYITVRNLPYLFYVLYATFMLLTNVTDKGLAFEFLWPSYPILNRYVTIIGCLTGVFAILFAMFFLHIPGHYKTLKKILDALIVSYFISMVIVLTQSRFIGLMVSEALTIITTLTLLTAGIIVYRRGYKPALFYLVAWTALLLCVIMFLLEDLNIIPYNNFTVNGLTIGSAIETLLLSLALANRIRVYKKAKEKAQSAVLLSLEDNRRLITEQNEMLEKKVEDRTLELKQSNKELNETVENLKAAQAQLIQSEKMASLGELTAGIAHEIQNPLNFVNNFSEINKELLDEMNDELNAGHKDEAIAIAKDVRENEEKINHHGKRADSIVKGMLQHSRTSAGQKEPTDINVLADEYLRLSYHGLRAKDKSFNATMHTDLDAGIGKINVIPQDIGRVLLNLYNNAFYEVGKKANALAGPEIYEPTVSVSTKKKDDKIEIIIKDNGNGIPQKILDKIFQPFFTTKPTGEGTGLGLSLSYDAIKAHNGEIRAETKDGEGAAFIILLPA
jgi:two-component system NtrC family sensor kinase